MNVTMAEWRVVPSTLEVSNDGCVRIDGIEHNPSIGSCGYKVVHFNGKIVLLHRLIALTFIPNPDDKPFVDHINGDKLDNRVENLRWATREENNRNQKKPLKKSGLPRGVQKEGKRFRARIRHNGTNLGLGTYATVEEASAVYEAAAQELFGEFYREPI